MASVSSNLSDIFTCPLSYEILIDPVSDHCGHTFERQYIVAWLGRSQTCPLSKLPCQPGDLRPNLIVKAALEVLAHQPTEPRDAESQADVDLAVRGIQERIAADQREGIPSRMKEAFKVIRKEAQDLRQKSSNYYC